MNARQSSLLLGASSLALVVSGWLAGVWQMGLAAPLAVGLAGVGFWARRAPEPSQAGWLVVLGAAAAALGLATAVWGDPASGLLAGLAGLGGVASGVSASLRRHVPPPGLPRRRSNGLAAGLSVALDESLQWAWKITSWSTVSLPLAERVAVLQGAAERHREQGVLVDPALAHPTPPPLEKLDIQRVRVVGAGEAERLRFESEFVPRDPEVVQSWLELEGNRRAQILLWRHREGSRPALLCVHGYGMGRPALDARAFEVSRLFRELGLDVALALLPLHGHRAPGRRSGAGFLDGHPLWTNAAFGQAVWELRRVAGWLRQQGSPRVGVWGLSLGGRLAALLASLDAELACAVPQIPAVDLPRLLRSRLSEVERSAQEAAGLTAQLLSEAWAPHEPLRHQPRVALEARLLVAGQMDRICPPEQACALWEHWDRPPIHWFPGSHLVPLGRRATRERLYQHLRDTLLGGEGGSGPALSRFRRQSS